MNTKQEVLENLVFADQYISTVFSDMETLPLIITGGASFLLKGFGNKFTLDIDSITDLPEDVLHYLESFAINNSASEVTTLPASYVERLISYTGKKFNVLNISLLSNEDLIISKIGRLSDDDLNDIINTGILDVTNFELLSQLAEEVSLDNEEFKHKWMYFQQSVLEGAI